MVSALDSGSGGPGSSSGRGTASCSWARYLTLIVPLSTQMYKWVPANLLLGVTLRWTSTPSRGGVGILLVASCYGNRDKLWPDGPLGSYTDFTLAKCMPVSHVSHSGYSNELSFNLVCISSAFSFSTLVSLQLAKVLKLVVSPYIHMGLGISDLHAGSLAMPFMPGILVCPSITFRMVRLNSTLI